MTEHFLRARVDDPTIALRYEDESCTYAQWIQRCVDRAALCNSMLRPGPVHVGVLLDNVPEFTYWLGALTILGATAVGINPTRRGEELARDIRSTDCQFIVTDSAQAHLLDGLDLGLATGRVLVIDSPEYLASIIAASGQTFDDVAAEIIPDAHWFLLFTSGTSGAPKAVIRTYGRVLGIASAMTSVVSMTSTDTTYISMPLFHSNALFTAWVPSVLNGATIAMRRRFSASEFLPDVRRFGATYFNYVGKPLAYVLATPEQPDDSVNSLRIGFGNEANEADIARFTERFGCPLVDGYGQTETGASVGRVPGMPKGALGLATPETKVLNSDTGDECPRAIFNDNGQLLNAEDAIGEIVNTSGTLFEGYYNNDEANAERLRDGAYWTGDLAYRDAAGYFYFAGRTSDWLRVDGENFSAAPVERIINEFPGVVLSAVYAVPDDVVGDAVMAAILMEPEVAFDSQAFGDFLKSHADLGTKWAPRFVRIVDHFPMTETNKVLKRSLVLDGVKTADVTFTRRSAAISYEASTVA